MVPHLQDELCHEVVQPLVPTDQPTSVGVVVEYPIPQTDNSRRSFLLTNTVAQLHLVESYVIRHPG